MQKRTSSGPSSLEDVAKSLCEVYRAIKKARASVYSASLPLPPWKRLDTLNRRYFLKAAEACTEIEASPKDYIQAQFDAFAMMKNQARRRHVEVVIPFPYQLAGLAAQVRYYAYQRKHGLFVDDTVYESEHQAFFCEERKLAGYARHMRKPQEDILAEMPQEFSEAFLRHRGVWGLVASKYRKMTA
jgi:hypothetical protein